MPMERWDLVRSPGEPDDTSWLEDAADEALSDRDASERFLQEVLSPSTKASRDFRGGLRRLISQSQDVRIKEISRTLGYIVVWPPGSAVRIGDVGSFPSDVSFTCQTQISALGIDMPLEVVVEEATTNMLYSTSDVSTAVNDQSLRVGFAQPAA